MNRNTLIALPLLALALAGCSSTGTARVAQAPVATQPVIAQPMVPTTAQTVQTARLTTSIANGFVDPAALALMTAKDSNEANSAQFYALQFGRPGAPRQWAGDKGTTGSVAVGPYVRVNNLDSYVAWCEAAAQDSLDGKGDHTLTFIQRAYFIQTGHSVPLLA